MRISRKDILKAILPIVCLFSGANLHLGSPLAHNSTVGPCACLIEFPIISPHFESLNWVISKGDRIRFVLRVQGGWYN
jgi:hypothetical protein